MREIPLTRGFVALVDDEDYERINQHKWNATPNRSKKLYATRTTKINGNNLHIKMHRVITDAPDGMDVDHINGDTFDNRKSNLRICTRTQNNYNSVKRNRLSKAAPVSKYKGVRYSFIYKKDGRKYVRSKPWTAGGRWNQRNVHLGYFETEIEAAKAYDKFAKENYGEYAKLNFPGEL